ncbi:HxsD-like protein [Nannocystis bainbridge]|uniref:HxsD-like protein n=1 Tax=Nannocystis bainbridge TaxID=2995303 RepID=A0ABT5E281_9BACT|nr:HxsD-like protein [Nannocystis bainbridge]MDC0719981.1 HxsD-like protein [Nannocystis bainbridge]
MTDVHELRFSRQLYSGEAVDQAVKAFARFAVFELEQTDDAWVVRMTPSDPNLARRLRGELGNHALGLTVQRGGAK